ncbi:transposase [Chryseobacterium joostei]|uniref:transposase n=1 Tax=Chryseobacterium joostei TaxID=112234 RepID=UPI003D112518
MYKDIHIGSILLDRMQEMDISEGRICNYLKLPNPEIKKMFNEKSMDTEMLLRWSKLLEYDFFRIYSQHLILYSPKATKKSKEEIGNVKNVKLKSPQFRKNIYTKEIIDFILEQLQNKQKTRKEIIEIYQIPKSTLCKWVEKYGK